jgi:glycosyltransferase involved in cell wall biosynthesis
LADNGHDVELALLEDRVEHAPPRAVKVSVLTSTASKGWLGKRLLAHRLTRNLSAPWNLLVSTLPFADEVTALANLPRHWCRIANTLSSEVVKLAANHPYKARRRLARYRRLYGRRPLIAVSIGVAKDLQHSIGVDGPIEIIPNPFDFEAMRQAAVIATPELPNRPYVVHVGRFAAQKRHDLLLDAWSRVGSDHLLVLLCAPDPHLQAMIDSRGLADRVFVAGFQLNPYPWIAGADLLVLCSDHEGLPNVLIEALACSTPVVSTDCPSGPREILAAFPECLVPCGNAATLAKAISDNLAGPIDPDRADLSSYAMSNVVAAYERLAGEG